MIVRNVWTSGELEDLLASRGDPVAVVAVSPRDRAPAMHVVGNVEELLAIVGGVASTGPSESALTSSLQPLAV